MFLIFMFCVFSPACASMYACNACGGQKRACDRMCLGVSTSVKRRHDTATLRKTFNWTDLLTVQRDMVACGHTWY